MTDQFYVAKPHAESHVTELENVQRKAVRIYRDSPYTITVQVRTCTAKRGRISSATLTRAEAIDLSRFLIRVAEELRDEDGAHA